MNHYKGFELFNDVEDEALRIRNRGVVMANIACDHSRDQRITPNGVGLILGYFMAVLPNERESVKTSFVDELKNRGWALTNVPA